MGFNTTIVILNDGVGDIENDEDFGKKIYDAIIENHNSNKPITLYSGNRNVGQVIEQHHSSQDVLIIVGGNTGEVYDNEFKRQLLWSSVAGKVAERKEIVDYINRTSSQLFIEKQDKVAHIMRKLADDIADLGKENEKELQTFIEGTDSEK